MDNLIEKYLQFQLKLSKLVVKETLTGPFQ